MRMSRRCPHIKLVLKQVFHDPAAEEACPAEHCDQPPRGRNRLIVFRHELFPNSNHGSRAIRCSLVLSFPAGDVNCSDDHDEVSGIGVTDGTGGIWRFPPALEAKS